MKKQKPASKPAESVPEKVPFLSTAKHQAIFIFVLACILYLNTLGLDYNLDDGVVITGNKFTKLGFKGIGDILTHDSFFGYFGDASFLEEGRYRPLTQVFFAVLHQFFGLNPFIGHLMNVLFYAFTCVFIFYILKRLFRDHNPIWSSIPFLATALFVAHPLHTEVVANIKGMDEIASLFGSLLTLYFSLRFIESGKKSFLLWMFVSFFLALLSKENAITFFAIIPLTIFVFERTERKNYLIVLIPMVLGFFAYMGMRYNALGFITGGNARPELLNDPFLEASKAEKYATILYTWGKYLYLLIFPHPLTHDYYPKQVPIVGWGDVKVIIPLVICTVLFVYSLLAIRKKNIAAYAILFFVCTFSISSNLIVPVGTFMNERFMFSASIGFCLLVAYLLVQKLPAIIANEKLNKNVIIAVISVLLLGYSVKTISRNPDWKDGYTLFTTDVHVSSNSAKCNTSAGGMMMEKALKMTDPVAKDKLLEEAMVYMTKAAEIHPKSTNAWLIIGRTEIERKNLNAARAATENCLKISPAHGDAYNNLRYIAQEYRKLGQNEAALSTLKSLYSFQPARFDLKYEIAMEYEQLGNVDTSMQMFSELIKEAPGYMHPYRELGEIYAKHKNDIDKALTLFLKANELDKYEVTVLENLGVIYGMKQDYEKSIQYFMEAIAVTPKNAQLYRNTSMSYRNMGQIEKADEYLKKASELEVKK